MNELENSEGYKEAAVCIINKNWLDFFINKYSFFKIKEFLDKNYENDEQRITLNIKKELILFVILKIFFW